MQASFPYRLPATLSCQSGASLVAPSPPPTPTGAPSAEHAETEHLSSAACHTDAHPTTSLPRRLMSDPVTYQSIARRPRRRHVLLTGPGVQRASLYDDHFSSTMAGFCQVVFNDLWMSDMYMTSCVLRRRPPNWRSFSLPEHEAHRQFFQMATCTSGQSRPPGNSTTTTSSTIRKRVSGRPILTSATLPPIPSTASLEGTWPASANGALHIRRCSRPSIR
jgi:hypothetical protein